MAGMRGILMAVILGGAAGTSAQEAPDGQVVELRSTIAKIVDVKSQDSEEASGWQGRKAEMDALLDLHRRELALLDEELEKAGQSAGGFDEQKRGAEVELETLKRARQVAREVVVRHQERMLGLAARFPEPLREETEVERISLAEWKPDDEPREGLQAVLGMTAKAEQFNRRITRRREEREGREVEVIYLGLARAYYADRSGNAGVGEPSAEGWRWTSRPDLNGEVVKALDQLDKKRPPELVELPVRIMEAGQ